MLRIWRIRLASAGLLALSLLSGCQCLEKINPFSRSRDAYPPTFPTSYPIAPSGDPNCGCQQGGAPIIYGGPNTPTIIPPGATLPNPNPIPTIPPAGIKESPGTGKQFETNGNEMSKGTPMPTGPILAMPVAAPKK